MEPPSSIFAPGWRGGKTEMVEIIACEEHDQVYEIWRQRGLRNLRVTHVDFHCDMRGLLIDRPRQQAYFIGAPAARRVDPGNFLAHAIMEGTVSALRWVHGPYGGRRTTSEP
jgi:hypothetical protein